MDYSALPLPKVSKHVQTKAMRDALKRKVENSENKKVRARSEGRCEIVIGPHRCPWFASHIHHKLMGRGVRGIGDSAKAEKKLHVCVPHHRDIHDKKLRELADGTWQVK